MTSLAPRRDLERDLEAYFTRHVRAVGGITLKIAPTMAGAPDRLVMLPGGKVFLVELKTETGTLRDVQKLFHDRAAALGTHVHVVAGRAGVRLWVAAALDGSDYCHAERANQGCARDAGHPGEHSMRPYLLLPPLHPLHRRPSNGKRGNVVRKKTA